MRYIQVCTQPKKKKLRNLPKKEHSSSKYQSTLQLSWFLQAGGKSSILQLCANLDMRESSEIFWSNKALCDLRQTAVWLFCVAVYELQRNFAYAKKQVGYTQRTIQYLSIQSQSNIDMLQVTGHKCRSLLY